MQQEQIQQEIVESPQFSELRLIFQQFNNTFIIGPNGSGKTTAVHYSLQQLQIPFRRINLMLCPNKQSLLKTIVKEINSMWSVSISPSTKFSEFIIKLHNIILEPNQKNRRAYIVIDAPQMPLIDFIYLKKLFALSEIRTKNTSINFIYICNQLPNLEEMPLGITYFFRYLDEKLLVMVIFQQIMIEAMKLEDFSVQNIHEIRTMAFETAKDVVVTYSIFTRNLHVLNTIAIGLFSNFVYKCTSITEQEQNQIKIQYKLAKKVLMENPYLSVNSKDFPTLIEKQLARKNDKDNKQSLVERKNAVQTLESTKIRLPKIPALILLSSYYASRNPEKTDQIIFQDLKKNKKSKQKEQLKVKQKVTLHRLIAITQGLMSITEPRDFSIEKQYFTQSLVFYQQIQQLVESGLIKQHIKKDDILNKIKFECQITEKQAYDLSQLLNIPFDEFLAKY